MNELLTLMISSELARVEGRDQSAAIQRTASIVRRETKDPAVYSIATKLAGPQFPAARITSMNKLQLGLYQQGFL